MKRTDFEKSAPVYDRIINIEKTLQELEDLRSHDGFIDKLEINYHSNRILEEENQEGNYSLELKNISKEIFIQGILDYYINVLGLELKELEEELDRI